MRRLSSIISLTAVVITAGCGVTFAAERASVSKAQLTLESAAEQQKFTIVFFWKENNSFTKEMLETLKGNSANTADRTKLVLVNVTDPAEKEVVARFDVSRSPMPLILVVAPNGAVTGVFAGKPTAELVQQSLVTPRMSECMKAMQDGKLVLLCVQPAEATFTPRGVKEFQADPQFQKRTAVISMQATEPAETRFMKELQVAPASLKGSTVVFMAPPGVMVGKFAANVSKDELATKLHAAGKCCDDKNCKHNH